MKHVLSTLCVLLFPLLAQAGGADVVIENAAVRLVIGADGLRQERASITDFHGLINQRVHIVLEQRAASAKAEQYWSGVKIVAGIAGVGGLAVAGIASVARLG